MTPTVHQDGRSKMWCALSVKVYSKIDYGACRLCNAFLGGMPCHIGFILICAVILGIHLQSRNSH